MENLNKKAIKIKGKKYVLISDRVLAFNDRYPNGQIQTELLTPPDADRVVVRATVTPDINEAKSFTGHSQALWGDGYINASSALENAETSAVGRALAMMGIGVIDSIASIDEIKKAESEKERKVMVGDVTYVRKEGTTKTGKHYVLWKGSDDTKVWSDAEMRKMLDSQPMPKDDGKPDESINF